ncbi:hypothetical protein TWF751_004322 [Orbilia oligospora]|nr:hypothetical protein TWF751_004322 [Orbilia oligospora]
MHILKILTTLTTIVLAAVPASSAITSSSPTLQKRGELGCHKSGTYLQDVTHGNKELLEKTISEACNNLAGIYSRETERQWCAQFRLHRIDFSVQNWTEKPLTLHVDECTATFRRNAMDCPRGSYNLYHFFYFSFDPNFGSCWKPIPSGEANHTKY